MNKEIEQQIEEAAEKYATEYYENENYRRVAQRAYRAALSSRLPEQETQKEIRKSLETSLAEAYGKITHLQSEIDRLKSQLVGAGGSKHFTEIHNNVEWEQGDPVYSYTQMQALQDQIDRLTKENGELHTCLNSMVQSK